MALVSDTLRSWFDSDASLDWNRRDEALAWASSCGDDFELAWRTCPRGDDLMLLAGALQAPLGKVIPVVGRAARPRLVLLPRGSLVTRAVFLAEHWGEKGTAPPRDLSAQLERYARSMTTGDSERTERAITEAVVSLAPRLTGVYDDRTDALRAAIDGAADPSAEERDLTALTRDIVDRLLAERESRRPIEAAIRRYSEVLNRAAAGRVAVAGSHLLRAVECASTLTRTLASLLALEEKGEAPKPELAATIASAAISLECVVYDDLSSALSILADVDAPTDDAVASRVTLLTAAVVVAGARSHARPEAPRSPSGLVAALARRADNDAHRAFAESLRAAVPYAKLAARAKST